jgi:hypothetical protein
MIVGETIENTSAVISSVDALNDETRRILAKDTMRFSSIRLQASA